MSPEFACQCASISRAGRFSPRRRRSSVLACASEVHRYEVRFKKAGGRSSDSHQERVKSLPTRRVARRRAEKVISGWQEGPFSILNSEIRRAPLNMLCWSVVNKALYANKRRSVTGGRQG